MQVSYDSGVNGSKFTDKPYGIVPLGQAGHFWDEQMKTLPWNASGPQALLVREADAVLRANMSEQYPNRAVLSLDQSDGSLWSRIQSNFDRAPDVISDVVAPTIVSRIQKDGNPFGLS